MRFIKNFIFKKRVKRLTAPNVRKEHPLVLLPDIVQMLHTLYHTDVPIVYANSVEIDVFHRDISLLLEGLDVVIEAISDEVNPREYRDAASQVSVVLYDFCRIDNSDNYMSPDRLIAVTLPYLQRLEELLHTVDAKSPMWNYYGRLTNHIIKDVLTLAMGIYGVKK